MLYSKIDNQLKKLSTCLIKTDKGVKKLSRLLMKQGSSLTSIDLINTLVTLGEDMSSYGTGTLVFDGQGILLTQPGSHSFVIPNNVTKVHMVAIGAGGSGGLGGGAGAGGGGGGLAAVNNVAATSGQVLSISVGQGGAANTSTSDGFDGGTSLIQGYIQASGGSKGLMEKGNGGQGGIGSFDVSLTGVVIGTGGQGGLALSNNVIDGAGGGGAAGYGGSGGQGGGVDNAGTPINGSTGQLGGGGGGGAASGEGVGGHGGGVGPFGMGSNGTGAVNNSTTVGYNANAGSVSSDYPTFYFGAGSGGADDSADSFAAQNGAVLICWGEPLTLS